MLETRYAVFPLILERYLLYRVRDTDRISPIVGIHEQNITNTPNLSTRSLSDWTFSERIGRTIELSREGELTCLLLPWTS